MNARSTALAAALVAVALTFAQDVRPGLDFYHTWQYATLLALAIIIMVAYAAGAWRGKDGALGKPFAIVVAGALAIAAGGFTSGLIGPDTETVSGSPGTVTPVADLHAAAFFGQADAAAIARGEGTIDLRTAGSAPLPVPPGGRLYLGTSIVYLGTRPAAYIDAFDARGNHLTITQPGNAVFLSPVLLFPNTQALSNKSYPLDTFATPGIHRIARVLYFSADDAATFAHVGTKAPALVVSVNDDQNRSVGLTIVTAEKPVTVGGLRIAATIGTYPRLVIAAAPHPALLIVGMLAIVGGLVLAVREGRGARALVPSTVTRSQT